MRLQANHCLFMGISCQLFFYFYMQVTASDAQGASFRQLPYPRKSRLEAAHRHADELHRVHHTQVNRRLRTLVAAVVQNHFPQCRERSHLTLRKVVVYWIAAVLEEAIARNIIHEVTQFFHELSSRT